MNILKCHGLSKSYGNTDALKSIDLELGTGKIVGLLGPNGSGKTTLIKLANGLLKPSGGELLINDMMVGPETKAQIAYLPDRDFLPGYMTIDKLLNFYEDFFEDFNRTKALKMIDSLDLPMDKALKNMSKGTREKVQLILVMSRDAKIYFLDEPIAGVDPAARDYILKTIISNYCEDSLVVISTHLIADIEAVLDEVVFIKNGQIVLHQPADEIREKEGNSVDKVFREVFKC
ncbi:MAG: ABC transporter ATP-binding protein [Anaerovoracaceae bacterium]